VQGDWGVRTPGEIHGSPRGEMSPGFLCSVVSYCKIIFFVPSPQGASAVIVTENPFGFTKGDMVKLAMSCDPADLKGLRTCGLVQDHTGHSAHPHTVTDRPLMGD
jgi:hypothetical protein